MKPVASGSCLFLRVREVNLCGGSYKWRFSLLGRCGGADTVSRSRGMLARRHGAEGTAGWGGSHGHWANTSGAKNTVLQPHEQFA